MKKRSDFDKGAKGRRKEPRLWLYTEHWLWGSTRSELESEERAVWIDFLCLGIMGAGKVDITYPEQLAGQLRIPFELFEKSLEKFKKFEKIKIKDEKRRKKTYAIITNWKRYQPDYLHDRPEKSTERPKEQKTPVNDSYVDDKEERRGGDRIGGDRIEENDSTLSAFIKQLCSQYTEQTHTKVEINNVTTHIKRILKTETRKTILETIQGYFNFLAEELDNDFDRPPKALQNFLYVFDDMKKLYYGHKWEKK